MASWRRPISGRFDAFDAELGASLGAVMTRTDTVIMGRVGYQEWAGYWPNASADEAFAAYINAVPKFVASHTLKGPLDWQNATVIEGELDDFVRDLKAKEGGEIAVMASISVVRQLLFAGLLDELTLITHPVVAANGRHLFQSGDPVTRLALKNMIRTSKGNIVATYARA